MNERIKELAKESGIMDYTKIFVPEMEKFVELIVLECIETIGTYENSWTYQQQMELLKKHFGVEE